MKRARHTTAPKSSAKRPVEKIRRPRPLAHSLSHYKSAAAVAAALLAGVGSNDGATVTWTGGGGDTNWTTVANWDADPYTNYGTLIFNTGGTQGTTSVVDSSISQNRLLWQGTQSWTLNNSGGAVISLFDDGGTQARLENFGPQLVTINAPITFAATTGNNWGEINAVAGNMTFGSAGTLTVSGSGVNGIRMFGGAGRNTTFNNTVSASGKYFSTNTSTGAQTVTIGATGAATTGNFFVMNDATLKIDSGGSLSHTTPASEGVRLGGDFATSGNQDLAKSGTLQFTSLTGGQSYAGLINPVTSNTSNKLLVDSLNTSGTNTLSGSIFLDSNLFVKVAAGGTVAATGVIQSSTGNLIKYGDGTLDLQGANTYSATTVVDGGTLRYSGASGASGSTLNAVLRNRGTITLDNSGTNNTNRINNSAGLTLGTGGGTLNFIGNAGNVASETIAAATISSGALTVNSTNVGTSNTLTITAALSRPSGSTGGGGTLLFSGPGAGSATNQLITTAASSIANTILPWAVVNDTTTGTYRFATHNGAASTLRQQHAGYTTAETSWTAATILAASTAGADVTLGGARTAFSLTLDSGSDILAPAADRTLTLGGTGLVGGVLQTGGTSSIAGNVASGFDNILAFGTSEAAFTTIGTLHLGRGNTTTLTGSGGLTKSGPGTLIVETVSGITGNYRINEGILEARRSDFMPVAQALILNGGTFRLANQTAISFANTQPIHVASDSTINVSRTAAGATLTHTVGPLSIGAGRKLSVSHNLFNADTGYRLVTGAITLNGGGSVAANGGIIDVTNNGTGIGTVGAASITGAFPLLKLGTGDLVLNAGGYSSTVEVQAGRAGWAPANGLIVSEAQLFSGAGGIVKSGPGTVRISGANTFTGEVALVGSNTAGPGALQFTTVGNNGSTAATSLGMGTNGIILQGGSLSFVGTTAQSTDRVISLTRDGILDSSGTAGVSITYAGSIGALGNNLTLTSANGIGTGTISGGITQTGNAADVNVTSGTWTFSGTPSNIADDFVVSTAGTVVNLNSTGVLNNAGTTANSDAAVIVRAATLNLGANNAIGTTEIDRIVIGDGTTFGTGTLAMGAFNQTIARIDLGAVDPNFTGNITGTGTLTVTNPNIANFINVNRGTISANLAGNGQVVKSGLGTVTFSGSNVALVSTSATTINAGSLVLDYTTNNDAKLASAPMTFQGGNLTLNGSTAGATTQTVGNIAIGTGAARIDLNNGAGQSATLTIGSTGTAITRGTATGTLRFEAPTTGSFVTNQLNNNETSMGIIGGWATITDSSGNTFFARKDAAGSAAANIVVSNVSLTDAVGSWVAGDNVSDSAGYTGTTTNCISINSLRFNAAAASTVTLPAGGIVGISSGGILVTSTSAGGAKTITGGRLVSTVADMIVTQDNTTDDLTIASKLVGNTAVTKGGAGKLILTGSNEYTGITQILQGTLTASGGSAIGDNSRVNLSDDQASTFEITSNETIGSLSGGNAAQGLTVGTVAIGGNTLTLSSPSAGAGVTYAGFISGSGSLVKNGTGTTSANLNLTGTSAANFTGSLVVNGGLMQLSALGSLDATAVTVNKNGAFLLDKNGGTRTSTAILDTTTITLNSADGTTQNATLPRGLWIRLDQNTTQNETIGTLAINSGANYASLEATAGGALTSLVTSTVTRANNGTLNVRATNLGSTVNQRGRLTILTANEPAFISGNLIGGGTGTGSKTISILPWGIAESVASAALGDTSSGNSLVTYIAGFGFRNLDATPGTGEYNTFGTLGGATDNIRESLAGNLTGLTATGLNALVINNSNTTPGTPITVSGSGGALAVTSGALLFTSTAAGSIGTYGITLNGFAGGITVGATNEYVIHVVNASAGDLGRNTQATIGSPLTSTADITKSGRGTLILSVANTAGGASRKTTINEGVLQIGDLDNIGGNSGDLVFAGGTLQFDPGSFTDDVTTRTITYLNGGGTIDTNNIATTTFSNSIGSGTGPFTKAGAGNLTLSGATTRTGNTNVTGGTLTLGANDTIGIGGDLSVSAGATFAMSTFNATLGNVTLANTGSITGTGAITGSGTITLNGGTFAPLLAGTANLVKATNATTATPSNVANSFTGYTHVQDGTLATSVLANTSTVSPLGAPTTVENGAIRLGNAGSTGALQYTGTASTGTNREIWLVGTTGGGVIGGTNTTAAAITISTVRSMEAGAKTLTLRGVTGSTAAPNVVSLIDQCFGLLAVTKDENGSVWSLPNANNYTNGTNINAGTLMIGNNGALGTGTITFGGGILDNSGASRSLSNALTFGGTATVQGVGNFDFTTATILQTGGSRTLNVNNVGITTLGTAGSTLTLSENNQPRTFTLNVSTVASAVINATIVDGPGTGIDGFTKTNSGAVTLNGPNTFTGLMTLANGTIIVGNNTALGIGNELNVTGNSTIQADGSARTLAQPITSTTANNASLTFGGSSDLSFTGNITNANVANRTYNISNTGITTLGDAAADTLTVSTSAGNLTFAGSAGSNLVINSTIQNGTGAGSITKIGPGTMTYTAANTYTGTTAVENGTLILTGGNDRILSGNVVVLGTSSTAGTIQLGSNPPSDQTFSSLTTSGASVTSAVVGGSTAASTLTVNNSANITYDGMLGGTAANNNNLHLVKGSSGNLILSGANTYTGSTTVNGGKLFIDSALSLASVTSGLRVADTTEFALRGTSTSANVVYGFSGTGEVSLIGSGAGTAALGFALDGAFNTQLALAAGQTLRAETGSTVQTTIYVNNAPIGGQDYVLIDGTDIASIVGHGAFDLNPVVFNGGSFTYALRFDTLINGGGIDQWVLTPTAQAAAADVWWKGDLTGAALGVWSASLTSGTGFPTNWDDSQSGGVDALVPPDSGSIVHFSADGADNFLATTLGANLRIQELIFHGTGSGAVTVGVGGVHTLTLGNGTDGTGLTVLTSGPDVSFTSNVRLNQTQSWNLTDSTTEVTLSGALNSTAAVTLNVNDQGGSVGTLIFDGANGLGTYGGPTNIFAGRVHLNGGANNRLPTAGDVTIGTSTGAAVLQLGNVTGSTATTIGNLSSGTFAGSAIVGGNDNLVSTLTVTQGSAGTFHGVIGGASTPASNVALVKQGTATLILNGASNYRGTTTINNGTLQLGSTGSVVSSSAATINANAGVTATLDINGRPMLVAGLTLAGADTAATPQVIDTATGGTLTVLGNILYDGTNNPLAGVISANLNTGTATRTITANNSTTQVTDLTISGTITTVGNTLGNGTGLTLDGTGDGLITGVVNLANAGDGSAADLNKNGLGTWTIQNTINPGDDVNLNNGTLTISGAGSIQWNSGANGSTSPDFIASGQTTAANLNVANSLVGTALNNRVFARNGAVINIGVSGAFGSSIDQIFLGDATNGTAGVLNTGTFTIALTGSAAGTIQLGAFAVANNLIGNITGTGTINNVATLNFNNGSATANLVSTSAGNITKDTSQTVTLSGQNNLLAGTTLVREGSLTLDHATNNGTSSKIGTGNLTMGSTVSDEVTAILSVLGNASATTQQNVANIISAGGPSTINITSNGFNTALRATGTLTRTAGTLNYGIPSASTKIEYTGATTNTNGIIGGWATVNKSDFATIVELGAVDEIQAATYTTQNNPASWSTNQNITNSAGFSGTVGDCNIINSLRFNAAAGSTVTIGNILIVSSGGIMVTANVGNNSSDMTGGILLSGLANGELIFHQHNTANTLSIDSQIRAGLATTERAPITKTGAGSLTLSNANNLTGVVNIDEGVLRLTGGGAISDTSAVTIRNVATAGLELISGQTETIGTLSTTTAQNLGSSSAGVIINAGATLTVNQLATGTVASAISGTGGLVKSGTGILAINSASTGHTGPLTVNNGRLTLGGNSGALGGTSIIINGLPNGTLTTIGVGELQDDQDAPAAVNRIADGATVTLNNTMNVANTTNGLHIRNNNIAAIRTETISNITLGAGHNVITAQGIGSASAIGDLTAATLTRNNRSTLLVRGNNLGGQLATRGDIRVTTTPTGLVGAGGSTGATTLSIFPYIIGSTSAAGLGNTFVTNVGNGLRPLDQAEYVFNAAGFDALAGSTGQNVRFDTGAVLSGTPTSINSLVVDAATAQVVNGPASALEVRSGGLLFAGGGSHNLSTWTVLTTAGADYTVHVTALASTATISVPLTTAVPLTKSGAGSLALTAAGVSGINQTFINQGFIQIDDLDRIGTGTINFFGGGLRLNAGWVDDLSTRTLNINTGGGLLDTNGINTALVSGLDDSTPNANDTFTKIGDGTLTINAASTFTGTLIAGHSSSAANIDSNGVTVLLNGTTNLAVNGNLQIGSSSVPGAGTMKAGVALGASEQIVNTATLSFNGASTREAGFKLLGFTETVAGISDISGFGIIENHESVVDTTATAGTLIVNSASDFSYNGFMRNFATGGSTGLLAFTKLGTGTQSLVGANIAYTGATTISAGTLRLVETTGWSSAITNNATLELSRAAGTTSFGSVISGTGAVTKTGLGTVGIPAATVNTYAGKTSIEGGTLTFGASANLGDASATNTIRIANGSTLSSTAASAIDLAANRAIELAGISATINVSNAAGTLTVPGVVSGPDCPVLIKTGPGLLILTGVNTYDAATTISAGTLQLGDGGTTGNLGDGNVSNSGIIRFNRSNAYSVPNIISGTGSLEQTGTGTTTLTGTNTYTGVTTISLGTLSVGTIGNGGGPGNMGNAAAAAANLVLNGGTLLYTGAGETTNRGFTLGTAGGAINASGTGPLVIGSGGIAYTGVTGRNLTLTGTGTGNDFTAALANATGVTSLTKTGTGDWTLSGSSSNTYTGVTNVLGGTLYLNKSVGFEAIPGDGVTAKTPRDIIVNGATASLVWGGNDQIGSGNSIRLVTGTVNFNNFNQTLYELKNVGGTVNYGTGTVIVTDPTWYASSTNTISGPTTFNTDLNVRGGNNTITGTGTGGAGTLTVGNPTAALNFIDNDAFNDGEDDIAASPTEINITVNSDNATSGILRLTGNVSFAADTGAGAPATFNSFASITSGGAGANPGRLDLNGTDRTFTIANSTQTDDMLISASIVDVAGGGTSGLTKEGAGTLELRGSNTYGGDTTINNGTLKVTNGAAIHNAGSVIVANTAGAIFEVNGNETIGDISGGGATGGEVVLNTGNTLTIAGGAGSTTFNGVISGTGNLTVSAIGTITLESAVTGGNTFTGDVTIGGTTATLFAQNQNALAAVSDVIVNTGGTLFLTGIQSDRINDAAGLTLGGGTFNTNGLSETLGVLTLTANSIIDFGAGASILSFADSSGASWGAFTLSLWNWSGNEIVGGGTDQIRFASNGLTAGQLGQIRFFTDAGTTEVSFDANTPINGFVGSLGEVVPVPEPGSVIVGLAMFGLAGWRERRKNNARRRDERAATRS